MVIINLIKYFPSSFQDDNMSGGESSGDSSDGEMAEGENIPEMLQPPDPPVYPPKPTPTPPSTSTSQQQKLPTSSKPSTSTASKSESSTTPSILSPLMYQTPQGMMYATPSNGGVILSLAQGDASSVHPQFITIPLSMVAANGQGELDLSKRK